MIRIFHLPLLILTMATCFWLASIGASAPVVPQKRSLSDQARSLSRLERLHIRVDAKDSELVLIGLTIDEIEDVLIQRVQAAGIETGPNEHDTAKLLFTAFAVTEERVPKGVACQFGLTLEQNVHLDGIEGSLKVPTFLVSYVGLEHEKDAVALAPRHLNLVVDQFLNSLRWARLTR